MGDGAYDADIAEELRGDATELREMMNHTNTGDVVWTAQDGKKTKLKDFGLKRLKAIKGHLKKNINHKDNADWLKIIQNEIKNRR